MINNYKIITKMPFKIVLGRHVMTGHFNLKNKIKNKVGYS